MKKCLSMLALLFVAVLLNACVSTPFNKTSTTLKAAEVRELFADKTVESVSKGSGLTSFSYYSPDGRVLQQRLWSKRVGKWTVKDNGKICLTFGKDTTCRRIIRVAKDLGSKITYYKIRKHKGKPTERVVRYRAFVAGNRLAGGSRDWPKNTALKP